MRNNTYNATFNASSMFHANASFNYGGGSTMFTGAKIIYGDTINDFPPIGDSSNLYVLNSSCDAYFWVDSLNEYQPVNQTSLAIQEQHTKDITEIKNVIDELSGGELSGNYPVFIQDEKPERENCVWIYFNDQTGNDNNYNFDIK